MYGWTDQNRAAAISQKALELAEANKWFALIRSMIAKPDTADIGLVLGAYVNGVGTVTDVTTFRFRQLATELGRACGHDGPDAEFFTRSWWLSPEAVDRFCPDLTQYLITERSNAGVEKTEILEASPNDIIDPAWPHHVANSIRRARRFPFRAYSSDDAAVFVDPFRFQILSRDLSSAWETGSPRCLTMRFIGESQVTKVENDVVVIHDRFEFANFCHYLYDGTTRISHFVDCFGYHGELFVLGGIPGRFHELVGTALAKTLDLPTSSFYFPLDKRLLRTSGKVTWFSDQKEYHAHPAQMVHPRSVSALARTSAAIAGEPGDVRRLYISRGDAAHRRVTNEPALIAALEKQGFTSVQLADIPVEQQIALFRGAEVVVGPHGMGLTNIVMGKHIGRVIELFHPNAGTDAYARMAITSGINYDHITGAAVPDTNMDFSIDADQVAGMLDPEHIRMRRSHFNRASNLIPASQTFLGFSARSPEPSATWIGPHFDRMIFDQETCVHRRDDIAGNSNVGEWRKVSVIPAITYCASCWVWLPAGFSGTAVHIRLGRMPPIDLKDADIGNMETWQRIFASSVMPAGLNEISISLHILGQAGCAVVSTAWQLERGGRPTAYVATG